VYRRERSVSDRVTVSIAPSLVVRRYGSDDQATAVVMGPSFDVLEHTTRVNRLLD
jgi:hypothetical protein